MTPPVHVTDHAVLRYLERVVGLDVEALRAEIAEIGGKAGDAPCIRVEAVRYIVRGRVVVTVFDGKTVPDWRFLSRAMRGER